jgi:hypothetical protein
MAKPSFLPQGHELQAHLGLWAYKPFDQLIFLFLIVFLPKESRLIVIELMQDSFRQEKKEIIVLSL